jgi:hypothetical protein
MICLTIGGGFVLLCNFPSAAREGPVVGLVLVAISIGLIVFGYYIFLRPLWRAQAYYSSFGKNESRQVAVESSPRNEEGATDTNEEIWPYSVQCDQLTSICRKSLAERYEVRPLHDKEFSRHEKTLRNVVNPRVAGQIEIIDAYEVATPHRRLIYAVVSYQHEYSTGRGRREAERVGQLVLLSLGDNLGRLWIRPETMSDKVLAWWGEDDLDIVDNPQFSRRYYCQASEPTLVQLKVPDAAWLAIGNRENIVLLAHGNDVIVAKEGPLDSEHSVEIVALGFELMSAFAS